MKNLKDIGFNVRMTENEKMMVQELAKELKMNMSEVIRHCIRDKYNSLALSKNMYEKFSGEDMVRMMEIFAKLKND